MLVLAIGTFTDPSKIGPYAEAETATIHAHKAAGIVAQAYQRVDGKGRGPHLAGWKSGGSARAYRTTAVLTEGSDDRGAHGDRGFLITLAVVGADAAAAGHDEVRPTVTAKGESFTSCKIVRQNPTLFAAMP